MSQFKEKWEQLAPNTRRNLIVGSAAGVALVLGLFFVSGGEKVKLPSHGRQEVARNIFTSQDTRQVGIDSINTEVKTLKQEKRELSNQVDQIDKQAKRLEEENKKLQVDLAKMQRTLDNIARDGTTGAQKPVAMQAPGKVGSATGDTTLQNDPSIWERRPGVALAGGGEGDKASAVPPGQSGKAKKDVHVRTIGEKDVPIDTGAPGDTLFIPAGSILTGTLITGVDAPTHNSARRNPMPMLFRVKHEALLPNFFTADVRECFVVGAGYGELSSERAYARSESITCIRDDGGVIEVPLDAYAVGEDGKAGLRGRLVSKQGAILAKAMAAGFLEAFANMFTKVPVPQVSLTPGSTAQYQTLLSNDSLQSAAMQGAGKALDRLAQFYIDMAEQYFPIIEVDAGRRVEFVLNHGVQLRIRGAAPETSSRK